MKKSLFSILAVAALFAACVKPEQKVDTGGTEISADVPSITVAAQNVEAVTVNVTADGEWLATSPDWITLDPSSAKGSAEVTVTVADNVDSDGKLQGPRSGAITLSLLDAEVSFKITVEQEGDDALDTRRTYVKVDNVTSGKDYLLVVKKSDDSYNIPILFGPTGSYGYPKPKVVELSDGSIQLEDASNGLIFTAVDGGYTIQQSDGRYIWHQTGYNTWSCGDAPTEGNIWTVEPQSDGTVKITDTTNGGILQYGNGGYDSYAAYSTTDENSILPWLYEDTKAAEIDDSKCYFEATTVKVDAEATTATLKVISNLEWTLTKTEGDWVTDFTPATGSADAEVTVTFTANESEEAREAKFHLASNDGKKTADLTLTQGSATVATFADIIAQLADGDVETSAKNVLVVAVGSNQTVVYDGTAYMFIYDRNKASTVGDIVNLSGTVTTYNGCPEWNNPVITVVSQGNEVTHPEATLLDADAAAAYAEAPVVGFYEAEAVRPEGTYFTLPVGDYVLNIYANGATTEAGKTYHVTGYTIGFNSSRSQINYVLTSYEEVEVEVPVESDWTIVHTEFLGPGWKPDLSADATVKLLEDNGLKVVVPAVGGEDWQAQVLLAHNSIVPDPEKNYTFSCKVKSSIAGQFILKMSAWDAANNVDKDGCTFFDKSYVTVEAGEELEIKAENFAGQDVGEMPFCLVMDFAQMPNAELTFSDIRIVEAAESILAFDWRTAADTVVTVPFNEAGAYHWYIDADPAVEFEASVTLNGEATTEGVTIEKYEAGGGHIAINYAANTDPADKVWAIKVTSASYVEKATLKAQLTQGGYEYSDMAELNAAIVAKNGGKFIVNISKDNPLEVTKRYNNKSVFAQNSTGAILLYNADLYSLLPEYKWIVGKFTATATVYNGLPEITAVSYGDGELKIGNATDFGGSVKYPCFNATIAEIEANYYKYVNAKCKITNLEVTKTFGTTKEGEVKDASGTIAIYSYASDITANIPVGSKAEYAVVWPTIYKKHQLGLYEAERFKLSYVPGVITMPSTKSLVVGDTLTIGATVNSGATITYASSDEAVATVSDAGLITAKAAGTATITASADATGIYGAAEATCTVTVTAEAVELTSYTLDGDAIKAAHTSAWSYTSGEKTITATDESVWTAYNTYAGTNQVTVQMNKGKGAYILTPTVPTGKKITKITVVTNAKADASGDAGTRPLDILSADGTETLHSNVTTAASGLAIDGEYTALRVICNETNGGATYVVSVTVDFE